MPVDLLKFIRKSYLPVIILLFFFFPQFADSQGFTYHWGHPSPQGNTVYGITFKDAETGWAVTGCGSIMSTTDGEGLTGKGYL